MVLRGALKLKQTKIYNGHRSFQLRFATGDSVELFKFMYRNAPREAPFKRKLKLFEEYFTLRPSRVDVGVERILKSLS